MIFAFLPYKINIMRELMHALRADSPGYWNYRVLFCISPPPEISAGGCVGNFRVIFAFLPYKINVMRELIYALRAGSPGYWNYRALFCISPPPGISAGGCAGKFRAIFAFHPYKISDMRELMHALRAGSPGYRNYGASFCISPLPGIPANRGAGNFRAIFAFVPYKINIMRELMHALRADSPGYRNYGALFCISPPPGISAGGCVGKFRVIFAFLPRLEFQLDEV
ncbi:MAG: hypothetical protein VZQ80_08025 [Lachnospiraceae bacterium]|nr:hypothetical protein [Lachnospiraceae bacterium]